MILIDVVQGTPEWQDARLGIPTASQFHRILSPKQRKASSSQGKYLCELVAERLLRLPVTDFANAFMARGSAFEEQAVAAYEFETGRKARKVGFVLEDGRRWGASPDRLVGEDGALEIKVVSAANHIAALLGMKDDDHATQCQGQMLVGGLAWVDNFFYNPSLPSALVRYERDEEHITELRAELVKFHAQVEAAERRLRSEYGFAGEGRNDAPTEPTDGFPADAVAGM